MINRITNAIYNKIYGRKDAEILTCGDIKGQCCHSCHDDVDYGFELSEIYDDKCEKLLAIVCCDKVDDAEDMLGIKDE